MNKRKLISVFLSCIIGWGFTFLATNVFRAYAYGLFIWLPTVMGAITTMTFAYRNETNRRNVRNLSFLSMGIFCLGLLTFAWEGVICLLMAAPVGLLFTYVGYRIGYWIIKLAALPDGHTLLEGTTWYVNKIKPGIYWTLWSDFIIHKIHERVLSHIKIISER